MKKRLISIFVTALLLCGVIQAGAISTPDLEARHVLLVEPKTGTVLYEKAADEKAYPASITKIMTCLLALEKLDLNSEVTASESAFFDIAADGSSAGIIPGETLKVSDLLYCVMVASANEACNIIAEAVAGSVPAFIEMMNQRAQEIGCENTHFANTHGLHDENHYTTARDIYKTILEAMKHEQFMEIANTASFTLPATNKHSAERVFYTTNHLISKNKDPNYIYYPAHGIKTGHHSEAGQCLTSSAQKDPNGLYLISVVLGAQSTTEGRTGSFVETTALFEWGFKNFSHNVIITSKEVLCEIPVKFGADEKDHVTLVPQGEISATIPVDLMPEDITRELYLTGDIKTEGIEAPVTKGTVYGEVKLIHDGVEYGTLPLVASVDVPRDEFEFFLSQISGFFNQPWVIAIIVIIGVLFIGYIVFAVIINRKRRRNRSGYSAYKGKKHRR